MLKKRIKNVLTNNKGFGIKEIAITLAVILVIGVAATIISNNMGGWISELWSAFKNFIGSEIGGF